MIRQQFDVRLSSSRRLAAVLVLAMAALVMGPGSASAVDIQAGFELMTTEPGTEVVLPGLPAGFFGPGCDAVSAGTTITLTGDPTAAGVDGDPDTSFDWPSECHADPGALLHCIEALAQGEASDLVDTIVERIEDGSLTPGAPVDAIAIEIVELSLVSTSSLSVTGCNAGAGADFTASVSLDGAQTSGSLTLTGTVFSNWDNNVRGTSAIDIPVGYQISFEEDGNPSNVVGLTGLSGNLAATGTFTAQNGASIPVMSSWAYILFGGLFLVLLYVYAGRRRTA